MPFQPVPDTCRVELRYTWNLQQCMNTLYFKNPLGWSVAALQVLCQEIADVWSASWKAQQAATVTLRELVATQLESEIDNQYTLLMPIGSVGTAGTPSLPNNVSFCVSFRTGLTGRSARGRNYFVGLVEGAVVDSTVNSASINAIVAGYQQVLALNETLSQEWVIVQRYSEGNLLPQGITRAVNSIVVVDAVVDSQRRRLPGRGL